MKCVITALGRDNSGIIAEIGALLKKNNINVEDITQTIVQNMFTMIMLVNTGDNGVDMKTLHDEAEALGKKLGIEVRVMHEDIFNAMHKI